MPDEAPYTKRELDGFFTDLRGSLSRIEQQLSNNEKAVGNIERRIFWSQGFATALSLILTLIIIPMVSWLFIQVYALNTSIDKHIQTAINTSLEDYGLIKQPK